MKDGWTWADVWMMAGILALEWRHRGLRELWIMYQFATMDNYDHTSQIMSSSAFNPVSPSKLHPFRKDQSSTRITRGNIGDLGVFTRSGHRGR